MDFIKCVLSLNFFNQIVLVILLCEVAFSSSRLVDTTNLAQLEFDENQVIRVKNGTTIKLVCNFGRSKNLATTHNHHKLALNENILWIKDNIGVISINGQVKLDKKKYFNSFLFSSNMDVSYTLSIANLQLEDSGRYTCQHFDQNLMKYFDITVIAPSANPVIKYTVNKGQHLDEISSSFEQIGLIENDSIDLECSIRSQGYQSKDVLWLKNGYMFSNQSNISLNNLTSNFHLNNFTCILYNEAFGKPIEMTLRLFLYFKPRAYISLNDYSEKHPKTKSNLYKVIEHTNETLTCKSHSNPQWVEIEWYKNGEFLSKYQKKEENDTDIIKLYNIDQKDSGSYQCRLFNQIGKGMHEIYLEVQYKPNLHMPTSYTAIEDTSVQFTCQIESMPNLFNVKWFKNGQELYINTSSLESINPMSSNMPDYQIETNDTFSILRLFRISSNDHKSSFKCVVNSTVYADSSSQSKVLKAEADTELNVLFKPIIDKAVTNLNFKSHENVTLKCLTRVNPIGQLKWYFNNHPLSSNSTTGHVIKQFNYDQNEYQQSNLQIINITSDQAGLYKCLVKNKIGTAEHSIDLIDVSVRPPPYNLTVKKKSCDNILLNWRIESTQQDIQFQVSLDETENIITTELTHLLIENLTDASEYMLKVRALYKNGFSEWSNVINVTTDWFNDTSDELLMIKICSLPNNLNFKVGLNQSCEEYLTNEQQPFMRNHLINMFIVIFVGIIFVLVLMLCCSLSCMNCKRMKLNQRFKSNILYAEQIKKRQAQLNYLNSITTSPLNVYQCENINNYPYPIWRNDTAFSTQPSISDDVQLSYLSSSKIMPIPECNESSQQDAQSIDSLRDEIELSSVMFNEDRHRNAMTTEHYIFREDGNFRLARPMNNHMKS